MEIFLGLVAAAIAVLIAKSVRIIGQAEVMVVERLGTFNRVARSGLNILIPFVERAKTIDVRFFESDVSGRSAALLHGSGTCLVTTGALWTAVQVRLAARTSNSRLAHQRAPQAQCFLKPSPGSPTSSSMRSLSSMPLSDCPSPGRDAGLTD